MSKDGDPSIDFGDRGEVKEVGDASPEAPSVRSDLGLDRPNPEHDVAQEQEMVAMANRIYDDPETWPETDNPEYQVTIINREGHRGAVIYDKASGELQVVFRGTASSGDIKQDLGFTTEAAEEEKANYGGHTPTAGAANTFARPCRTRCT